MTDAYAHALDAARKELAQIEDRKRELENLIGALTRVANMALPAPTKPAKEPVEVRRVEAATRKGRDGDKSAMVRALLVEGKLSPQQIAARVGCSDTLVYLVKKQIGAASAPQASAEPAPAQAVSPPDSLEPVPATIDEIVKFLRQRGFEVLNPRPGRFKVDRVEMDTHGLVAKANRQRERIGKPPFKLVKA